MRLALISFFTPRKFDEYPTEQSLHAMRLATFVKSKREEYSVEIVTLDETNWRDRLDREIVSGDFDLVGLPGYNWTLQQSKDIAEYLACLTGKRPLVVVGGPEASTFKALPWNDNTLFVAGQGEIPLVWLCDELDATHGDSAIEIANRCPHAIFSRDSDMAKVRARYRIIGRQENLPVEAPLFSGPFGAELAKANGDAYLWYETTRGCIYTCSFCGHNTLPFFSTFDDEIIESELEKIGELGVRRGFIIDPILGGKPKRGKWLLRKLLEHCPDFKFRAFMRPEFLDSEFLDLLEESNVEELYIGIQTLNPLVPDHVRGNRIDLIKKYLPMLRERSITWRAELIMGLPGDNFDGMIESIRFTIDELQPTTLHVYHFTSIEGTKLDDLVNTIEEQEWSLIDPKTRKIKASHSFGEREFQLMQVFGTLLAQVYMREIKARPHREVSFVEIEKIVGDIIERVGLEKCLDTASNNVRDLGLLVA